MADQSFFRRMWGGANTLRARLPRFGWADLLVVLGLGALLFGMTALARQWTGELQPAVEIDLSPAALPRYTLFSLARGLIAYVFSLGFTLVYGYWAAKDRLAERVLVPLLDILQSIPVLGFMPGLVLALVALFPSSNVGLELAAVIMIFTGQAWNMTFSFYHSVGSVPENLSEVATIFRFSAWERFRWVELPYSMMGLVWNSMMSMAGGWFFLMINEAFHLGERDFRLPGIGSYMSCAVEAGRLDAMLWAIAAMTIMIVALDQLLWRPVVVWAQKYRIEETGSGEAMTSWFLDWLRHSRLLAAIGQRLRRWTERPPRVPAVKKPLPLSKPVRRWEGWLTPLVFIGLLPFLAYGAWRLVELLRAISFGQWGDLLSAALLTLARVLVSTVLGTLWALPAGLAIGLSPRLSRVLQPVIQVVASFPAPMLFPLVIAGLTAAGVSLGWGSIALMLLGTQWYILFNVVAGAMAIPADLCEAAESYRLRGWQRFWVLYVPAVFPYLVTGWVTAAGGAWNASIVSEYISAPPRSCQASSSSAGDASIVSEDVSFRNDTLTTWGLGATISEAAAQENYPLLAASILVMSTLVVMFNRTVWRRCYQLAERRFSLNR